MQTSSRNVLLLLLSTFTVLLTLTSAAAADGDNSSFPTAVNTKSIPFYTGWSYTWQDPLFSFMSGPLNNILLTQHVQGISYVHAHVGDVVIQAFHAESGEMLYKKAWPSCFNDVMNSKQRIVDLNATHAIVLCSKTALNANNTRTAVPTVYIMDVETGDETWSAEARDPQQNNVVVNNTYMGNMFVEVAVPEEGLFAVSNVQASFVLNLQDSTFLRYNPSQNWFSSNGQAKAFCNKSKAFVYEDKEDDIMYAMRVPTREVIWHNVYPSHTSKILVGVGSQTFDIHSPRTATVVPVLFVDLPLKPEDSTPFFLEYVETSTGATVATTHFNSFDYPWSRHGNPLYFGTFSFSGPFLRNDTYGNERNVLIMNVENILVESGTTQTCGSVGLDVNGGPIWTNGFTADYKIQDNAPSTRVYFACQWHTNPTSSFGWLVRHGTGTFNNPIVTLVDIGTGATVASAAPSNVSRIETKLLRSKTAPHLYLPAATVHINRIGAIPNTISSTLMNDILLLKYPMAGMPKTAMVGIRLATNSTKPQFRGSFKINTANAQGMVDSTHYTIKTRLTQRFDNNTMLVPAFDGEDGGSRLVLVNISEFESTASDSNGKKLSTLAVALLCVCGVAVLCGIVAFTVRHRRRKITSEENYQQLEQQTHGNNTSGSLNNAV